MFLTAARPNGRLNQPTWAEVSGCLGRLDQAELLEHSDSIVETDLLDDQPVDDFEHRRAGEAHRLTAGSRQRTDRHVVEGRAGVCPPPIHCPTT